MLRTWNENLSLAFQVSKRKIYSIWLNEKLLFTIDKTELVNQGWFSWNKIIINVCTSKILPFFVTSMQYSVDDCDNHDQLLGDYPWCRDIHVFFTLYSIFTLQSVSNNIKRKKIPSELRNRKFKMKNSWNFDLQNWKNKFFIRLSTSIQQNKFFASDFQWWRFELSFGANCTTKF